MPSITMDDVRNTVDLLIQQKILSQANQQINIKTVMDKVNLKNFEKISQASLNGPLDDEAISISLAMFDTKTNELKSSAKGKLNPLQSNAEVDIDTQYNLGSVSKFIITIMVLRLVQNRKLSLDATIDNFFQEDEVKYARAITISDLLSHRTGLRDVGYFSLNEREPIKKFIRYIDESCNLPPNKEFYYANSNFVLIAKIIQICTQKSLRESFKDLIAQPLNLTGIEIINDEKANQHIVVGYKFSVDKMQLINDSNTYIFGASSFRGTPSALVKLISTFFLKPDFIFEHYRQAILNSLKDEIFEVVTEKDIHRWPVRIGMGIEERSITVVGKRYAMYGHGGWQDGYACFLAFVPQLKTAFCCCITKTQGLRNLNLFPQSHNPYILSE